METPRSHSRDFSNLRDADKVVVAAGALAALETVPDIVDAMGPRGYRRGEKLDVGHARLQAVRDEIGGQSDAVGDRLSATAEQNDALKGAHALYAPLAATARVLFKDHRDALVALGLTGEHGDSYGARLERMRLFAREARHPDRFPAFEEIEIEEEDFAALDAALDAAETGVTTQDRHDALSEHATDEREGAFAALVKWMLEMQGHARIVLRGKPQLLEMLGIPRR